MNYDDMCLKQKQVKIKEQSFSCYTNFNNAAVNITYNKRLNLVFKILYNLWLKKKGGGAKYKQTNCFLHSYEKKKLCKNNFHFEILWN